ncbi:MAG: hypothetical protein AABW53_02635 [Nanoarchaeota archaeon]
MIFQNPTFWLISGLSLNVLGSIILGIPLFKSKEAIKNISETCWDTNPNLPAYLIKDKKTGILGISLLFLGFMLQIISFSFQ